MRTILVTLCTILVALAGAYGWLRASGVLGPGSLQMILNAAAGWSGATVDSAQAQRELRVPEGFEVALYAGQLPGARMLRFTPAGDLLVSRPNAGSIVLLGRDADGDGRPDHVHSVIEGLNKPQGLDFLGDWLYIAERDRVGRVRFDAARGVTVGAYQPVIEGLAGGGNHWKKTLRAGPDGMLYLAQGSSCNVCVESNPQRATLMRFAPDGSGGVIVASGLRNSEGFDWSPFDGGLYATDNGRDLLGDDFPPCELNRIEAGRFYGWPYYNGDNVPDPDIRPDPLAAERTPTPPVHAFRAHNAPLGLRFVDTTGWPAGYAQVALAALHGSWNRSVPDGYKVVSLHFSAQGIEERDFLTGFLRQDGIDGRPVDVAQGPDGAIYVSDDYAGAIYRITPPH